MDPGIVAGIGVLSKVIGLGIKGWAAASDHDLNKEDLEALRSLLDTGASVLAMHSKPASSSGILQLTLTAHAFGRAVARHQELHGRLPLTTGLRRWLNQADKDREAEIHRRVEFAALSVRRLGGESRGELDHLGSLIEHPLGTPYYRALWRAFSDPALTIEEAGEQPPLVMSATARREFERYFLLAYLEGLSTPGGDGIDEYLEDLKQYRAVLVRDLLLNNLVAWGQCHVFGNVPRDAWHDDEVVPFMPLDEMYVEPTGVVDRDGAGKAAAGAPLVELIQQLTGDAARPKLVVVAADFGSGKSMTGRVLARRWAEQFLASTSGTSLDLVLPIHVRCAEDFPSETVDLELMLRRAWKRQANAIGYSISDDDSAFAWPSTEQRVVCLLDGLDEVALGEHHLKTLLQRLAAKTTHKHRFVIFTRPGVLPARTALGDDVLIARVQRFDRDQVEHWLGHWNQLRAARPPLSYEQLDQRNLSSIAETPILLFLIAFTWQSHASNAHRPSLAEIYEEFFVQIATGKVEVDRERHHPITRASEELLAALKDAGILEVDAAESDAMLWLMGRAAWEAHTLEQRQPPEPLTRWHIDSLLKDPQVPIPPGAADAIKIGLVLALQADLQGANHTILFGHLSFREFLVGRYWSLVLRQLVHARRKDHDRLLAMLRGGRLLGGEGKSFEFLMAFINTTRGAARARHSPLCWDERSRDALVGVMQDVFEDERQTFGGRVRTSSNAEPTMRNDQHAELREAALAIGSTARASVKLRLGDPRALRSMLAWFSLQSVPAQVVAPSAQLGGADLRRLDLRNAMLVGSDLRAADLSRADLVAARLAGADLTEANLSFTDLQGAIITTANLQRAHLIAANLFKAQLNGANLEAASLCDASLGLTDLTRANLRSADLDDATLRGAVLCEADLRKARLSGADLRATDLREADLRGSELREADLREADLRGADLRGADLREADLREADLRGADLRGADLRCAALSGPNQLQLAVSDDQTLWPQSSVAARGDRPAAPHDAESSGPPVEGTAQVSAAMSSGENP